MPSQSSSLEQARRALGLRLREIRIDADLTGKALASLAGWDRTKVSKIEYGKQPPTPGDITTWCRHCGADEMAPDLIAATRTAAGAYVEWRRMQHSGLRRLQEAVVPLYERTSHFRIYEPSLIPGLLQTPGYAKALMEAIVGFRGIPDDTDAAVATRMERQSVLHTGRRFAVLLEEAALRTKIGGSEVMAGQLGHLLTLATIPSVSLGVLPFSRDREMWPVEGFWIFDSELVKIELTSASVNITQPGEIAIYMQAFEYLAGLAMIGKGARALITSAIDDLDR
ncbi:helix-turn-helix transcriptional regulator [Streptosporangium subroseum]|uniref:helix-turn-helix domain-containing protein n=1 Tax=Streptosporangium subroseum TaxID=106412 RepID=UPI00341725EE